MLFPTISGKNLMGEEIVLPFDLEEAYNLIVVVFDFWQKDDVKTWRAMGVQRYEVALFNKSFSLMRPLFNAVLRTAIADESLRARTVTIYDRENVRDALEIDDEKNIRVFVVSQKGEIFDRVIGPYDGQELVPVKTEKATFAAGCFWNVEEHFRNIQGVMKTTAGYTGGTTSNPTYENIGDHAEAVEIEFDPMKITYNQLLQEFFSIHDYTQVDRQGPDVGTQYRSAIFFHNLRQKEQIQLPPGAVTRVNSAGRFHKAERYHQRYLAKMGENVC